MKMSESIVIIESPALCISPSTETIPLLKMLFAEGAVFAKMEFLQPTGSIKSRVAGPLVEDAFARNPYAVGIVDASSGGSGKAQAYKATALNKEAVIMMPEALAWRSYMVEEAGGTVHLVKGGMAEAKAAAAELALGNPLFIYTNQFGSEINVRVHRETTAVEIALQLPTTARKVRIVSGSGTGATLVGVTQGLIAVGYETESIIAIPVDDSGLFSARIPGVADRASTFIDWNNAQTIEVPERDALLATQLLIQQGIPCGPSSGLNLAAAYDAVKRVPLRSDEVIVTFLADHAREYRRSHPEIFR